MVAMYETDWCRPSSRIQVAVLMPFARHWSWPGEASSEHKCCGRGIMQAIRLSRSEFTYKRIGSQRHGVVFLLTLRALCIIITIDRW